MKYEKMLNALKENFERISVTKEVYDQLKESYIQCTDEEEREQLRLKVLHAKESLLKVTMHNKKLLESIEGGMHA